MFIAYKAHPQWRCGRSFAPDLDRWRSWQGWDGSLQVINLWGVRILWDPGCVTLKKYDKFSLSMYFTSHKNHHSSWSIRYSSVKQKGTVLSCFFQEIGYNSRSKMTSPQETNLEEFWPAGASSQESQWHLRVHHWGPIQWCFTGAFCKKRKSFWALLDEQFLFWEDGVFFGVQKGQRYLLLVVMIYIYIQCIHTSKDCIVKMILFGYNLFLLLHSMFD